MPRLALPVLVAVLASTACSSNDAPAAPTGKGAGEGCASASECRAGLFCFEGSCAASYAASPSCAPPGSSPAPQAGAPVTAVEPGPTSCPIPVRVPDYPDGGVQSDGLTHGIGDLVTFTIPPGTTAFSIVSQAVDAPLSIDYLGHQLPNTPAPTDVRRPDGTLFYSDTADMPLDEHGYYEPSRALAYFLGYAPATGVFTVPNTSAGLDLVLTAGEVTAGTWSFRVNDWANECLSLAGCQGGSSAGTYRIDVLTHPGAATPPVLRSTGTLDLEIYLATTAATLANAAAAAADPRVARLVRSMRSYYAGAGICIGNVTFHDLPQWAKDRWAPGGEVNIGGSFPCDALSQLFTLTVGGNTAVHLFLADALVEGAGGGNPGYMVLGVDGAIPGPSGVPGTVVGGAIAGLFDQLGYERVAGACSSNLPQPGLCGSDLVAYVAAHEAGHWLGLYHTTEATGDLFDPLSDTATCPCLSCAPAYQRGACSELGSAASPTLMESAFCSSSGGTCGGARNLMFWLVDDTLSSGELSPQQGEVMRLNPAVR